ncbi:hypothetical protein HMPREF1861_01887 [Corynebacterium kroppenstedtii]|nr:hypothetical protein HMPREF1861_01887 [Corynebacterium kroppenstedtii]
MALRFAELFRKLVGPSSAMWIICEENKPKRQTVLRWLNMCKPRASEVFRRLRIQAKLASTKL